MTDQITIPRALLEQALNALTSFEQNYGSLWYSSYEPDQIDATCSSLRAELAKPVERVEPITLDQFRAIANRTATTYRHRSDPEKSSYAFVDGSSLDDFWRKVCEAIQPTPAWNDAPEVAALKAERDLDRAQLEAEHRINSETLSVLERTEQKLNVLLDRATVAKAERDAAMKDAERYRWLTRTSDTNKFMVCDTDNQILYFGWEADEAIDAAIAKAEGRTE